MQLTQVQVRVLGSLAEKQLTTPQQYPLSMTALLAACNQTSNRHPVVSYDERTLEATLLNLKDLGLLRFVHPSHGRSVTRYRQVLEEKLSLSLDQLALLTVLLLRGPQTLNELRTRTERMATFDDPAAIERELDALAGRDDPLVVRLPRQPGQKELRYAHLLAGEPEAPLRYPPPSSTVSHDPPAPESEPPSAADAGGLVAELAALRADIALLRRDLDEVRAELGL